MPESPDPQEEQRESYDFRRFILRAAIAYDLASTPPIARIFKDSRPPNDRDNGPCDWELELSRQAQLRRGIDLKSIVNGFVAQLERDHGSKRAEQFVAWVQDGHISRIAYVKRGQVYADRGRLIDAIKAGGYRKGEWD